MKKLFSFIVYLWVLWPGASYAQMVLLNSFNPSGLSTLCGIGYNPDSMKVWVYGCSNSSIHCFTPTGTLVQIINAPGGAANDVDIDVAPFAFTLDGSTVNAGDVLFVNGENNVAEIFLCDSTGNVTDTLVTDFGNDHVVGGSYHEGRNSFFLVQDNVPGVTLENLIAEVDPISGDTLQTFQISNFFDVSFGDIETGANGNLFVVSSIEDSIAEFTPTGQLVQKHALPAGVANPSGIALDCANNEAWIAGNAGTVFHIGQFPCGNVTAIAQQKRDNQDLYLFPNPASGTVTLKSSKLVTKIKAMNGLGQLKTLSLNASDNQYTFDIGALTPGWYVLQVHHADGVERVKLNVR